MKTRTNHGAEITLGTMDSPAVAAATACSAVLARIEGMDVREVAASTQYGMGLLVVTKGANHLLNGIAFRDDSMSHGARVGLANEVNQILRPNDPVLAHADTKTPNSNGNS